MTPAWTPETGPSDPATRSRLEGEPAASLHALLATIHDAVAVVSPEGLVARWNPAAERLYGYRSGDILGRPMTLVAPDAPAHPTAKGQPVPTIRRHRSGATLDVEVTRVPLPRGWLDVSRDIGWRTHARRVAQMRREVAQALGEAGTAGDRLERFLEAVGTPLGAEVGEVWVIDPAVNAMRITEAWQAPERDLERFAACARSLYLPPGTGLPGRIWQEGRLEWRGRLSDTDFFVRAEEAEHAGLYSGLGFPLRDRGAVVGVALFLGRRIPDPDEDLRALLMELGAHVGQALALQEALNAREDAERSFEALFDALPVGVALLDPLGRASRANPAFCRALDVSPSDLEAPEFVAFVHPEEQDDAMQRLQALLDGRCAETPLAGRFVRSGGEALAAVAKAYAMPGQGGAPASLLVVFDDRAGP